MYLTIRIADEPCLMPMSVQPIDLETRAILLAAPAAAALRRECSRGIGNGCRHRNLRSRAPFFENVIVDCVYGLKRFASDFRAWHTDPERFLHAHHQLERIDGIQTEPVGSEKWKIVSDLLRSNLQHQIFTSISLIRARKSGSVINEARSCRKSRVWSNV